MSADLRGGTEGSRHEEMSRMSPVGQASTPQRKTSGRGIKRHAFRCGLCSFAGDSQLSLSMHMTQVHRPCNSKIPTRSRCVEAELYRRLRLTSPEQRKELLLRHLSQAQRAALERWILTNNKGNVETKDGRRRLLKPCAKMAKLRNRQNAGITRRCRRLASGNTAFFYVAHASAGPFRLCTKSVRDFGVAVRHRRLLQAIKQEVISKAKGGMPERLARIFAHAVHEVPARFRQTPRDIGLSFAATVPAKYWIGRELLTPRYSAERMEAGLAAFQALCRARDQVYRGRSNRYSLYMFSSPMEMEAAWTQLRQEYVRIWSEAGWDRKELHARLDRWEACRLSSRRSAVLASTRRQVARLRDAAQSEAQLEEAEVKQTPSDSLLVSWGRLVGKKSRFSAQLWGPKRSQPPIGQLTSEPSDNALVDRCVSHRPIASTVRHLH
mmetsp:Transcript_43799/g.90370  ORF Transcript_43799/g.90370 Transcript_43799/m.90370 type:complete len:438 (-) Transcript_43799:148-1461(-)